MTKFFGKVGYADTQVTAPGVHVETITEYSYYGDVVRNARTLTDGTSVNSDLTVNNSISIVADPFANEHYFTMRYVEWMGTKWQVAEVTVLSPRLLLRLGKVYNGPTP